MSGIHPTTGHGTTTKTRKQMNALALLHPLRPVMWLRSRLTADPDRERGDVPGWVMVTVMTAALVAALYAIAGDALQTLLTDALDDVLGT
jgi:hypothetical protein